MGEWEITAYSHQKSYLRVAERYKGTVTMAGLLFPTFNAARAPFGLSLRAFPSINSTDKCRSHGEMKEETEKI